MKDLQAFAAVASGFWLSGCGGAGSNVSDTDLGRICRAAVAELNATPAGIIQVTRVSGGIAQVRYRRPSDGTTWTNECRLEGDRVIWRMLDLAGPGTGPGRWRDDPMDEVVTYRASGPQISIRTEFPGEPEATIENTHVVP